ncbi:hypothetical protein D3C75_1284820 [compost metagenome]
MMRFIYNHVVKLIISEFTETSRDRLNRGKDVVCLLLLIISSQQTERTAITFE